MKFSLQHMLWFTTIMAIQFAVTKPLLPYAIVSCAILIFVFFILAIGTCVISSEHDGPAIIKYHKRLAFLVRGLVLSLLCFWALFFNSIIRDMIS